MEGVGGGAGSGLHQWDYGTGRSGERPRHVQLLGPFGGGGGGFGRRGGVQLIQTGLHRLRKPLGRVLKGPRRVSVHP